jgi:deoxyribose-phosphate aldolase
MEQNELIEQLTKEVLQRIRGSSGSETAAAPSPSSASTPPSSPENAPQTPGLMPQELARYIDHTLLKPDATEQQVEKLCEEARENGFFSVCVNSCWVELCAKRLRNSEVKVCSVVGFPLGAMARRSKGFETRHAVENGADEIDMVINIGALKSKDYALVEEDIRSVLRATRRQTLVKVIIEAALLTDEEKVLACEIAKKAEADYVKTSTGFAGGGATVHDVALMRRTVGEKMGVKAAGGIRTYENAVAMIQAGASRIGASAGVTITRGEKSSKSY